MGRLYLEGLTGREELQRRLAESLGNEQHASERIRVLEQQLSALEAQLLEANAAVAGGDPSRIGESKRSIIAMATVVLSLLAVAAAVAQPFISDHLGSDDTAAIVEAVNEATEVIEASERQTAVDLTVIAASQCIAHGGSGP